MQALFKKQVDYVLIGSHTREELVSMVCDFLKKNSGQHWETVGGIAVHGENDCILCYCQAVVRYEIVRYSDGLPN